MRYIRALSLAVLVASTPVCQALAADISSVKIGERYYVYKLLGDNEVVQVIGVDAENGAVNVRHVGGKTEWVRSEDLMNRLESEAADTATNTGVAVGIGLAAIVYCATYPEECKKK